MFQNVLKIKSQILATNNFYTFFRDFHKSAVKKLLSATLFVSALMQSGKLSVYN